MVTDPVNPGWTMYKEIEWIEIKGSQVNKELAEMIKGIGKFNIDSHHKKLRLSAYI